MFIDGKTYDSPLYCIDKVVETDCTSECIPWGPVPVRKQTACKNFDKLYRYFIESFSYLDREDHDPNSKCGIYIKPKPPAADWTDQQKEVLKKCQKVQYDTQVRKCGERCTSEKHKGWCQGFFLNVRKDRDLESNPKTMGSCVLVTKCVCDSNETDRSTCGLFPYCTENMEFHMDQETQTMKRTLLKDGGCTSSRWDYYELVNPPLPIKEKAFKKIISEANDEDKDMYKLPGEKYGSGPMDESNSAAQPIMYIIITTITYLFLF